MLAVRRLENVCEISMGQAPDGSAYNDSGDGWPLIAGAGDFGELHPEPKKYTTEASKLSRAGDIILGIRATIGEKVLSDGEYCLGRGVAGLRPLPTLDGRYLWHWLGHIRPTLAAKGKGATFKQVNKQDIGELEIALPTISEQCRMSAILDQADVLRAKRRKTLKLLEELQRGIFFEMFGDPVTNGREWKRELLKNIGDVVTGNTPPRENSANYGNAIEWIKSDNLNSQRYYATRAIEGLSEVGMRGARIVPANSILVTCIAGSPDSIGNCAMTDRMVAFNQQINAFIPRGGNPHFYYAQLRAGKRLVQSASTDGMKGLVSKGRFEQIELIVPPDSLQQAFAERVLAVVHLTELHRCSLQELDQLFLSLQARAFRGEL